MVRVLYIYSGVDREELSREVERGGAPDTSFFGFNHLEKIEGIKASFLQLDKSVYRWGFRWVKNFPKINAQYLYAVFKDELEKFDVIFVASTAYWPLLLLPNMGKLVEKKWFILNIDLTYKLRELKTPKFLEALNNAHVVSLARSQNEILEKVGLFKDRLHFIHFGIDKDFYKAIPTEGRKVLAIGRDNGRDYKTFLSAMENSKQEGVIVCSKANLEGLEKSIPTNVEVKLDLNYKELEREYENAIFLVNPAQANPQGSDCSGQTVILDAMAHGRAVIATDSSWLRDYFESGKHILTVPSDDVEALRSAVERLAQDDGLRASLARSARILIDTQYNSENFGRNIAHLIKSSA